MSAGPLCSYQSNSSLEEPACMDECVYVKSNYNEEDCLKAYHLYGACEQEVKIFYDKLMPFKETLSSTSSSSTSSSSSTFSSGNRKVMRNKRQENSTADEEDAFGISLAWCNSSTADKDGPFRKWPICCHCHTCRQAFPSSMDFCRSHILQLLTEGELARASKYDLALFRGLSSWLQL